MRSRIAIVILIFFASFFLFVAENSSSEEGTFYGDTVVVTATRIEEKLDNIPAFADVITSQELEETHSVQLIDNLKNIKGVTIHQNGTLGDSVDLRILGSGLSQSLILIDGVEVNSTYDGFFDFTNIFSDNIERIEVIKGAQSALYGSEAMGGVINIITKKGEGVPSLRFLGEGGKFDTFRENLSFQGSKDKFSYSMSLSRIDQNGQFIRDGYRNSYLSGRIDYELPMDSSLTLNFPLIHLLLLSYPLLRLMAEQ